MEDPPEKDQPLTPAGRLFAQPSMSQIICCAMSFDAPLDLDAVRAELLNSSLLRHPRFRSLMVRDSCGREHWRRTEVNVDRHFIVFHNPLSDDPDADAINDYMADLSVSCPLDMDKPLWEIHVLVAHKTIVLRLHHALGDGISLMSMLMTSCRLAGDPSQLPKIGGVAESSSKTTRRRWGLWTVLKMIWYTLVYVLEFALRSLWLSDERTALSGGAGVELWPRKLATATFRLDHMKTVKRAVPNSTINDVLFGIITCGFSRYMDIRSTKGLRNGLQITGLAMVNLRPQPGLQDLQKLMDGKSGTRWGNKFGMLLLPVYYQNGGSDPLQFVRSAKAMIDKKKLSLEAPFSYGIGYFIMHVLGAKIATILNYRIVCNTTFTISNLIGPTELVTLAGTTVSSIRATSSSLPHAITMHMVSYAGKAEMQILVAKEVIPDPKILAKCLEDALLEMNEASKHC